MLVRLFEADRNHVWLDRAAQNVTARGKRLRDEVNHDYVLGTGGAKILRERNLVSRCHTACLDLVSRERGDWSWHDGF
jgi:hypothetical protein